MTDEAFDLADAIIEAEEDFVIDAQFLIQDLMNEHGLSRADLAKKIGISKARLTQLMKPEANPTLRSVARVAFALGEKVRLRRGSEKANFSEERHSLIWNEIMGHHDSECAVDHAVSIKMLRAPRVNRGRDIALRPRDAGIETCHNDNGGWVSSSVVEVAA